MNLFKCSIILIAGASIVAGCTSGQIKARKEQREKVSQSSKLYCDFVNGETYPDVDVQLNLEMAKRCDADKGMTISGYHSPSDAIGMVYCCGIKDDLGKDGGKKEPKAEPKNDLKLDKPEAHKEKGDKADSSPSAPSTGSSPSSPSSSGSKPDASKTKPKIDKNPDKGSVDKLESL